MFQKYSDACSVTSALHECMLQDPQLLLFNILKIKYLMFWGGFLSFGISECFIFGESPQ